MQKMELTGRYKFLIYEYIALIKIIWHCEISFFYSPAITVNLKRVL